VKVQKMHQTLANTPKMASLAGTYFDFNHNTLHAADPNPQNSKPM
jgi:hypothetical protein